MFDALLKRHKAAQERADFHAALVAATVANTVRRKGPPAKVQDFMPRERRQRSPQQMLATVEMLNRFFGGQDKRKGAPG